MLTQIGEGVLVHESEFCQSNAVVVRGGSGALLIDAGVMAEEMTCLASDLVEAGVKVVAGFSTHPHWDHLLWHPAFGEVPRYSTARCAARIQAVLDTPGWEQRVTGMMPADIVHQVPLDLFGLVTGLPAGTTQVPWDGPSVQIIEHQAHATGHAALLIEGAGVLVAGDTLSDVLIPLLDQSSAEPIEDYLAALQLLEDAAGRAGVVIPGHGSVGGAGQVQARIDLDRAYLNALRNGQEPDDPRIGPSAKAGWEWVAGVHAGQSSGA